MSYEKVDSSLKEVFNGRNDKEHEKMIELY